MEFFQRGAKPEAVGLSGIVRTVVQWRRPDDPSLPLLTTAEAERIAKEFFLTSYRELDLAGAELVEMTPDRRVDWQSELEDRIASLTHSSADAEDPALGVEITLLRRAARRIAYVSDESRLLREFIRRALRQLWNLELARSRGDYRDRIADKMFHHQGNAGATTLYQSVEARSVAAPFYRVRASFEKSEIDGDPAITHKTREKRKRPWR